MLKKLTLILVIAVLSISCQTLTEPAESEQIFTFYPPDFPERPTQTWYSDDDWFYLSRSEAMDLVNWFSELRAYRQKMDITFKEIENVVNNLTRITIDIQ